MRSSSFCPFHQGIFWFWLLMADRLPLGWIGCQHVKVPFVTIEQISPFLIVDQKKSIGSDLTLNHEVCFTPTYSQETFPRFQRPKRGNE